MNCWFCYVGGLTSYNFFFTFPRWKKKELEFIVCGVVVYLQLSSVIEERVRKFVSPKFDVIELYTET